MLSEPEPGTGVPEPEPRTEVQGGFRAPGTPVPEPRTEVPGGFRAPGTGVPGSGIERPEPGSSPVPEPGVWKHFKGGLYRMVGVLMDAERDCWMVEYVGGDGRRWVRTVEDFLARFVRL